MFNSLITMILANPGYVSLGALVLSTFFAGTMLQGDRIRKQEIQEELREIQQLTEESLTRVQEIQTTLEQQDAALLQDIGEAYEVLATLNKQEQEERLKLEESAQEAARLAAQRRRQQQAVNDSGRLFFSN